MGKLASSCGKTLKEKKVGGCWSLLLIWCMLVHRATRYFLHLEGQGRVIAELLNP